MPQPEREQRPITTGSVLGEAVVVFARRWWRYVVLNAVVLVPWVLVPAYLSWPWSSIVDFGLYLAFPLASGAIAIAVLNEPTVRGLGLSAFGGVGTRGHALIIAGLVHSIVVPLGFLLFVVPGLFLTAMWSVFIPVVVAERDVGLGLGRSSTLTTGRRWTGFWIAALPWLLLVAAWVVDATTDLHVAFEIALPLAAGLVLPPWGAVAAAIFYRRLVEAEA